MSIFNLHSMLGQSQAMGEIARALGKEVVAKFVEKEASLNLLKEYKIDFARGYLPGRPVQIETLFAINYTRTHLVIFCH